MTFSQSLSVAGGNLTPTTYRLPVERSTTGPSCGCGESMYIWWGFQLQRLFQTFNTWIAEMVLRDSAVVSEYKSIELITTNPIMITFCIYNNCGLFSSFR